MNKTHLKFSGYLLLSLTTLGVLLAVLGQLDFIGTDRPEKVVIHTQSENSDKNDIKYSFYEDLKNRKVEIDSEKTITDNKITSADTEKLHYVVQTGAFSDRVDASNVKTSLEKLGYKVRIEKVGQKHLVQVGPLKGKKLAEQIETKLKSKNYPTLIKQLR